MSLNLFQITSLFIIFFSLGYIWYRYKISFISNYVTGIVFIIFFCAFYFNKGTEIKGAYSQGSHSQIGALLLIINLFFFSILFVSSFCINFIEEDFRKKFYFLFPSLLYCIIVFIELTLIDPHEHFDTKFYGSLIPVFLAYFPLYILLYYKKYKND
jgi:hypothetical protein